MTSMIKARQELAEMRNRAAKGKRWMTREQAMDDFYQLMAGPSPEMQRTSTRSTLADYY